MTPHALRTDRLMLEPLRRELAQAIASGARDVDWAPGFPQEGDVSIARLVLAADEADAGDGSIWGPWEVRTARGALIGTAGFQGPPREGEVEIGYGIAPEQRGRGLASEAVGALLEVARSAGASATMARVDWENAASRHVLDRHRFRVVGGPDPTGLLTMRRDLL
ncbi:MAG: GNAT family N-acetyltransferase [Candidatus Nanopelagicales bacterium]